MREFIIKNLDKIFRHQYKLHIDDDKSFLGFHPLYSNYVKYAYRSKIVVEKITGENLNLKRFGKISGINFQTIIASIKKSNLEYFYRIKFIDNTHVPKIKKIIGEDSFNLYLKDTMSEFKLRAEINNLRSSLYKADTSRSSLILELLDYDDSSVVSLLTTDQLDFLFFDKNSESFSEDYNYLTGYFITQSTDSYYYTIDFLNYRIQSLTPAHFKKIGLQISENELENYKIFAKNVIQKWRIRHDPDFDFSSAKERYKHQILAMESLFQTMLAYVNEISYSENEFIKVKWEEFGEIFENLLGKPIRAKSVALSKYMSLSSLYPMRRLYAKRTLWGIFMLEKYFKEKRNQVSSKSDIQRLDWKLQLCMDSLEKFKSLLPHISEKAESKDRDLVRLPKNLGENLELLLIWLDQSINLEGKPNHALGFKFYRAKELIGIVELTDSLVTDWFAGFPIPKWMVNGVGFHLEHAGDPMSLIIEEITATSNPIAQHIAHQLTYECKMELKKKRRDLLNLAINKVLNDPTSEWQITKKDFIQSFNFPLEFKEDLGRNYLNELREELNIPEGSPITFFNVWSTITELNLEDSKGKKYELSYSFEEKLNLINYKIFNKKEKNGLVNLIKKSLKEGKSFNEAYANAYRELIQDTKFMDGVHRAERLIKVLSILINNKLIGVQKFGKIIDPYSWIIIKQFFNIDMEYPNK
jgi:hypothetical protein